MDAGTDATALGVSPAHMAELVRCSAELQHFSSRWCYVKSVFVAPGPQEPMPGQLEIWAAQARTKHVMVVKGRGAGATTAIAIRYFWKMLFEPGYTVRVLAKNFDQAEMIFEIYRDLWSHLPKEVFFLWGEAKTSSKRALVLTNGSSVTVLTSLSEDTARGSTANAVHATEVAFFPDPRAVFRSVIATTRGVGEIVIETTANGMNEFYDLWRDEAIEFDRLFVGWLKNPYFRRDRPPTGGIPVEVMEAMTSAGVELHATELNWWAYTYVTEALHSLDGLRQEYPLTALMAFVATGASFFGIRFNEDDLGRGPELGEVTYLEPDQLGVYTMGIDAASGSEDPDADCQAISVIRVGPEEPTRQRERNEPPNPWLTRGGKEKPAKPAEPEVEPVRRLDMAYTFYGKLDLEDFAELSIRVAMRYGALVVPEHNNHGAYVTQQLRKGLARKVRRPDREYRLWRRMDLDPIEGQLRNEFGWLTDPETRPRLLAEFRRAVQSGRLEVVDPRLRWEMNGFVHVLIRGSSGVRVKPMAGPGRKDDLIFATALAVQGLTQIGGTERRVKRKKPEDFQESIAHRERFGVVPSGDRDSPEKAHPKRPRVAFGNPLRRVSRLFHR